MNKEELHSQVTTMLTEGKPEAEIRQFIKDNTTVPTNKVGTETVSTQPQNVVEPKGVNAEQSGGLDSASVSGASLSESTSVTNPEIQDVVEYREGEIQKGLENNIKSIEANPNVEETTVQTTTPKGKTVTTDFTDFTKEEQPTEQVIDIDTATTDNVAPSNWFSSKSIIKAQEGKTTAGTPISKEQEKTMYDGWADKGFGQSLTDQEGNPMFQIYPNREEDFNLFLGNKPLTEDEKTRFIREEKEAKALEEKGKFLSQFNYLSDAEGFTDPTQEEFSRLNIDAQALGVNGRDLARFLKNRTNYFNTTNFKTEVEREFYENRVIDEYLQSRASFLENKYKYAKTPEEKNAIVDEFNKLSESKESYKKQYFPELVALEEEKRQKDIERFKKVDNGDWMINDKINNFIDITGRGAKDATVKFLEGFIGMVDKSKQYQLMESRKFDRAQDELGTITSVKGKTIDYNGRKYKVTKDGNIVDEKTKLSVNNILSNKDIHNITEAYKKSDSKETFLHSTEGYLYAGAETIGALAPQLLVSRGVNGVFGAVTNKMAPSAMRTFISKRVSEMASVGGFSYTQAYSDTLDQLVSAGISEDIAKALSAELASKVSVVEGLTGVIIPNASAHKILGSSGRKELIKDVVEKVVKGDINAVNTTLKDYAKKGVNKVLVPIKEGVGESIQEVSASFANKSASDDVNKQIGREVLETTFRDGEFLETMILSGAIGGVAGSLGGAKSSIVKSDLLSNLRTLSKVSDTKLSEQINYLVDNESITREQGEMVLDRVKTVREFDNKVPPKVEDEKRLDVAEKLREKSEIENEKKVVDPIFHEEYNQKIEQIDNEIKTIVNETTETKAEPLHDNVQGETKETQGRGETTIQETENEVINELPKETTRGNQEVENTSDAGVLEEPKVTEQPKRIKTEGELKDDVEVEDFIKSLDNIGVDTLNDDSEQPNYSKGSSNQTTTVEKLQPVVDKLKQTGLASEVNQLDTKGINKYLSDIGVSDEVRKQVDVWHGSPHSFDKFTTEAIGTGEGNQAFGWGLYFTDVKSIARNYATSSSTGRKLPIRNKVLEGIIDGDLRSQITEGYSKEAVDIYDEVVKFLNDNKKFIKNTGKLSSIKQRIVRPVYMSELPSQLRKDIIDDIFSRISPLSPNLYKTTLHKGKQPSEYTWLEWDRPLTNEQKELLFNSVSESSLKGEIHNIKISDRFDADSFDGGLTYRVGDTTKIGQSDEFTNTVYNTLEEAEKEARRLNFLESNINGKEFYESLAKEIGQKEASLFLLENGIDGIKYPAESISRGATSDNARGFNYVVFDENAVTIEEQIKFQKELADKGVTITPKGFVHNGKVFINTDTATPDTPIHEFSHLYSQALKESNPEIYKQGLLLIKKEFSNKNSEIRDVIDYVKQTQPNLKGEALYEEVLAELVGRKGVELIEKNSKSPITNWIKKAFDAIKGLLGLSEMSTKKVMNLTVGEYADAIATDLLKGNNIGNKNIDTEVRFSKGKTSNSVSAINQAISKVKEVAISTKDRKQAFEEGEKTLRKSDWFKNETTEAQRKILDEKGFEEFIVSIKKTEASLSKKVDSFIKGVKAGEKSTKDVAGFLADYMKAKLKGEDLSKHLTPDEVKNLIKKASSGDVNSFGEYVDGLVDKLVTREAEAKMKEVKKTLSDGRKAIKSVNDLKNLLAEMISGDMKLDTSKPLHKFMTPSDVKRVMKILANVKESNLDSMISAVSRTIDKLGNREYKSEVKGVVKDQKRAVTKRKTFYGNEGYGGIDTLVLVDPTLIPTDEMFNEYKDFVNRLAKGDTKIKSSDVDAMVSEYRPFIDQSLDMQNSKPEPTKNEFKEAVKKDVAKEALENNLAEVKEQIKEGNHLLSHAEQVIVNQLLGIPNSYFDTLDLSTLNSINKSLSMMINTGTIPNSKLNDVVTEYKATTVVKDVKSKIKGIIKSVGKSGDLINSIFGSNRSTTTAFKEGFTHTMLQHIDSTVKGLKGTDLYNNIIHPITSGFTSAENTTGLVIKDVGELFKRALPKGGSAMELNAKMQYYFRQREFEDNQDFAKNSKPKVFSIDKHHQALLDNKVASGYGDKTIASINRAYDSVKGKSAKEMYNSFSPAEKRLVDKMDAIVAEGEVLSRNYTSHVLGETPQYLSSYFPRHVVSVTKDKDGSEVKKHSTGAPSIRSDSSKSRVADKAMPLDYDTFGVFAKHINEVNIEGRVGQGLKESRATIAKMKSDSSEDVQSLGIALETTLNKLLEVNLNSPVIAKTNGQKLMDQVIRNTYKKMLIDFVIRLPQDLLSNWGTIYGFNVDRVPAMIKANKLLNNDVLNIMLDNINTTQFDRLVSTDFSMGSQTADTKMLGNSSMSQSKYKSDDTSKADRLIDFLGHNKMNEITDEWGRAYYALSDMPVKQYWKMQVISNFKKIAGEDLNVEKYKSDSKYRAEIQVNLQKAVAKADKLTSNIGNTQASSEKKLSVQAGRGDMKNRIQNFLRSFTNNEYKVFWDSFHGTFGGESSYDSKSDAVRDFALVNVRGIAYSYLGSVIAPRVADIVSNITGFGDDDEERNKKDEGWLSKSAFLKALAQHSVLLSTGNMSATHSIANSVAVNWIYQKLWEKQNPDKEFNKFDDSVLHTPSYGMKASDVFGYFGAEGNMIKAFWQAGEASVKLLDKYKKNGTLTEKDIADAKAIQYYSSMISQMTGLPIDRPARVIQKLYKAEYGSSGGSKRSSKSSNPWGGSNWNSGWSDGGWSNDNFNKGF